MKLNTAPSIPDPEKFLVRMLMRHHNIVSYDFSGIKQLTAIINKVSEETISVNTLARIAGIRSDKRKTYKHTLDLLARAAHYKTFDHFIHFLEQKSQILLTNESEYMQPFLVDYTRKAATNGDIFFLKELIGHIENNGCTINDIYMISGAFVEGLRINRSPKPVIDLLASKSISIELFFENHVDSDYFNGYYGAAMVEISKHLKEKDHLFLFSNAIALRYEKSIGDHKSYQKRGKKLLSVSEKEIQDMLEKRFIYPVARWIAASSDYLNSIAEKKRSAGLIEKILDHAPSLTPDERMILLSECSEQAVQVPPSLLKELQQLYIANKAQVLLEFDSLCNAGLNLSMAVKEQPLVTKKEIYNYMQRYPFQFAMCHSSLIQKTRAVLS